MFSEILLGQFETTKTSKLKVNLSLIASWLFCLPKSEYEQITKCQTQHYCPFLGSNKQTEDVLVSMVPWHGTYIFKKHQRVETGEEGDIKNGTLWKGSCPPNSDTPMHSQILRMWAFAISFKKLFDLSRVHIQWNLNIKLTGTYIPHTVTSFLPSRSPIASIYRIPHCDSI